MTSGRVWWPGDGRSAKATRLAQAVVWVTAVGLAAPPAFAFASARASAQAIELSARCVSSGGDLDLCLAGASAAQSLSGHTTLLSSFGSPIPGTGSNLGTRVGGGPRLSFFGQAGFSSWDLPDAAAPTTESGATVPALRLGAAAGLFEGIRLMPTVGGFLATDVFADASFQFPGASEGHEGGLRAYGIGARIGIFREGFTLPGLSVSVARRFSGAATYGEVAAGDAIGTTVDPGVTSVRAVVSKDLFAVEVLAGVGWDGYSGDASLTVSDGSGGSIVSSGSLDESRRVYFGAASMTFSLVLSLSVELGWAQGVTPLAGYVGDHDPGSGRAFGSFAARLVL